MPSRPVAVLIVLFWLGTLGWFGYREVWPKLRPGDAPPFVIELADEATSQIAVPDKLRSPDALWNLYRGDEQIGKAQTRLTYLRRDDTFELETRVIELVLVKKIYILPDTGLVSPEIINKYRLTRDGELRGIEMTGVLALGKMKPTGDVDAAVKAKATFEATVRGDQLHWTGRVSIDDFGTVEPKLDPVPAPRGIFLNPMHPVPKVKGLRPGRRWQMPVVDPLADIIGPVMHALQEKVQPGSKPIPLKLPTGPKVLNAEVLTETAMITWDQRAYECLIIEYRGEHETFRTYVRKSDGQVLRQESQAAGGRFIIQRQ